MRIAIFSPTVSGIGGIETATKNLMYGLNALGDQTHLFLLGGSYDQAWLAGVEYTQIGSPRDARVVRLAKYALGSMQAVARWHPDVIVCSDVTTVQMARLGRLLAGKPNIPIASWIHFPLNILRLKEKLHKADFHLAISEEIAQDLRALLPTQRDRIFTIYNAVQTDAGFTVPRPKGTPVFLYAGRLNFDDHKRVNDILQAAAKLRGDWRLKIIGIPPDARPEDGTRLHVLADELGIQDHIEWMGWQLDPWTAAGEVTALLLSSAREGFPMILLEAISHGVACVASACTGTLEIMIPGQNGWVYPIADVNGLAEHLQAIVDDPAVLPAQPQVQATALRFSAEAVAERAKNAIAAVRLAMA